MNVNDRGSPFVYFCDFSHYSQLTCFIDGELCSKSPHSLRSLPSAEFLRMLGNEEHQLHSPITPLSFDFNRKKRNKVQSPDILKQSSPDLVQRIHHRKKDKRSEEEQHIRSPDYSESDYAPVSTERWIITDNCQGI